MHPTRLFDAEYRFMLLVWEHEPVNSTELARLSLERLGWKKSTTYTVLKKLCDRGVLRNQNASVASLVTREDVQKHESKAVIEKAFGSSLPRFLTAFLGDRKITRQEADELMRIIEEAAK